MFTLSDLWNPPSFPPFNSRGKCIISHSNGRFNPVLHHLTSAKHPLETLVEQVGCIDNQPVPHYPRTTGVSDLLFETLVEQVGCIDNQPVPHYTIGR